jgi:mRNA interferase RelE/StbE
MGAAIVYSDEALRQLKKLNAALARRIVLKIADNASRPDPLIRAKALQGKLSGKYRYRIGDYRAIFVIDEKGNISILTVLSIKHRRDVYK